MLDPTCPSAHPHTFSYCSLPPAMSPFAHALDQPFLEDFGFESVHAAFRPSLSLPPLPNVRLFTLLDVSLFREFRATGPVPAISVRIHCRDEGGLTYVCHRVGHFTGKATL